MPLPGRPAQIVELEIARLAARRQVLIDARDRRENDMLCALHDVESHEQRIVALSGQLDALFDERAAAARAEAAGA